MRFESKLAPVVIAQHALRRPKIVIRATEYVGGIVDERVLTRAFPWIVWPSRLQVLAVRRGTIRWGSKVSAEGDVLLLTPEQASTMRFEGTSYLDLEWTSPHAATHNGVVSLGRVSREQLDRIAAGIADREAPARRTFHEAIEVARTMGAPLDGFDASTFGPATTERDERIASALCGLFANLATAADTLHLGEGSDMSPRQLQRVLVRFGETYGLGVTSWRDLRNRWRLQVAAVLLGFPKLAIADIASEVGYGSGPALARAFAKAGFPPPLEVRRRLLEGR